MSKDVPVGYKLTEVGVIPEDWEVKSLGDIGKFKNGINKGAEDFGFGSPFVNLMDVFGVNSISTSEHLGLINSNDIEKKIYDLKKGDVIFVRSSVKPSGVGLTTVVVEDLPNVVYSGFLIRFRSNSSLDVDFKRFCFSEEKFRRSVIANSTISANTNINQENLKKLYLIFPKSDIEQQAIAHVLSDTDALITSLDKLIAKKRDLKQAAMQQLLTGKQRLEGFGDSSGKFKQTEIGLLPEDWDVQFLRETCIKIQDGTHFSPSLGGNDYMYVTSKNIGRGIFDISNVDKIDCIQHRKIYNRCDVKKGDLLLTKDGVNTGNAALNFLDEEFSLLSSVAFLRFDSSKYEVSYFLQQILSSNGQRQIKELMAGNAITRLTLGKIRSLKFPIPFIEEQQAIAKVLSDMDSEISALEQRRDKTKALKQAMMQELLTGRIRLL